MVEGTVTKLKVVVDKRKEVNGILFHVIIAAVYGEISRFKVSFQKMPKNRCKCRDKEKCRELRPFNKEMYDAMGLLYCDRNVSIPDSIFHQMRKTAAAVFFQ